MTLSPYPSPLTAFNGVLRPGCGSLAALVTLVIVHGGMVISVARGDELPLPPRNYQEEWEEFERQAQCKGLDARTAALNKGDVAGADRAMVAAYNEFYRKWDRWTSKDLPDPNANESDPKCQAANSHAREVLEEAMKVMGLETKDTLGWTIKFNATLEKGHPGQFHYDPNNGFKPTIELGPDALRNSYRNGQLLDALHEVKHAIDGEGVVSSVATWLQEKGKVSTREAAIVEARKWFSARVDANSAYYAKKKIRAEKTAFECLEEHVGVVCDSLRNFSIAYQQREGRRYEVRRQMQQAAGGPARYFGKKVEFDGQFKQVTPTAASDSTRAAQFRYAVQARPVFGVVVLGNSLENSAFRPRRARIVVVAGRPCIDLLVDGPDGLVPCKYYPASATELAVAYNVVRPSPAMAEEYLLNGKECNLVHCEVDPSGLLARFAVHPAIANTTLARAACELDTLPYHRLPGLFDEIDPTLNSMQWYDEQPRFRVDAERLVVEAAHGPPSILLRARFWGTKASDLTERGKQLLFEQLVFSKAAREPFGEPITWPQALRVMERLARTATRDASGAVPYDSAKDIEKAYTVYPMLRVVDQFARTLAVLHWIGDAEDVAFPALPVEIKPDRAETPAELPLAEVANCLRSLAQSAAGANPALPKGAPQMDRWYAAFDGKDRTGWLHVSEFSESPAGAGKPRFTWESEQVIGLHRRAFTVRRRDSNFDGPLESFTFQVPKVTSSSSEVATIDAAVQGDHVVMTGRDANGRTESAKGPWDPKYVLADFIYNFLEHHSMKPGDAPKEFHVADFGVYGFGQYRVNITPERFETTDVMGESRKLLRIKLNYWIVADVEDTAKRLKTQNEERIKHLERIKQLEALRNQALRANQIDQMKKIDKDIEKEQSLFANAEPSDEKPTDRLKATETRWVDERGVLVKLEARKVTDPDPLLAELSANKWVQEELIGRRGLKIASKGGTMTYCLTSRDSAVRGDQLSDRLQVLERFPADVPIVHPSQPLVLPDAIAQLRLRVHFRGTPKGPPFPTTPRQTSQRVDDHTWELTLRSDEDGAHPETVPEGLLAICLRPTPFIESAAPEVAALAQAFTLPPEKTAAARELARLLFSTIRSSYRHPIATAMETLQRKEGDCKGHAVLLAALLRARGIPARIAAGVRYAQSLDAFVGHAWTEAYIDGRWLPFEPSDLRGEIGAAYIHLDDFPDFALPIEGYPSPLPWERLRDIDRIDVLEQRWKDVLPPKAANGPREVTPARAKNVTAARADDHKVKKAAFTLGAIWLDAARMKNMGLPVPRAVFDEQIETLAIDVPSVSAFPRDGNTLALINAARDCENQVNPLVNAQLRSTYSPQTAALFQLGSRAGTMVALRLTGPQGDDSARKLVELAKQSGVKVGIIQRFIKDFNAAVKANPVDPTQAGADLAGMGIRSIDQSTAVSAALKRFMDDVLNDMP